MCLLDKTHLFKFLSSRNGGMQVGSYHNEHTHFCREMCNIVNTRFLRPFGVITEITTKSPQKLYNGSFFGPFFTQKSFFSPLKSFWPQVLKTRFHLRKHCEWRTEGGFVQEAPWSGDSVPETARASPYKEWLPALPVGVESAVAHLGRSSGQWLGNRPPYHGMLLACFTLFRWNF